MSALHEVWEDYKWALSTDPLEHAMTFLTGFGIGLFLGGTVMWLL